MQTVINSAPAIQTPIDQQSTLKSEAVAVAPALSNASTQDLRAAPSSSVQPTQIKTVSEAIEAFADAVIREHNLSQFSAMPVDAILEPLRVNTPAYTPDEIMSFIQDFKDLAKEIDQAQSSGKASLTAGSPDAGKSTLFKALAKEQHAAFLDFDRSALQGVKLYQKMRGNQTPEEAKAASIKFRGASQTLHNCLMPYAISKKKDLAIAITSTSKFFAGTVKSLQQHGYKVDLHHMTCPNDVRETSNNNRNAQGRYQCDSKDFETKGQDFYKKTADYLNVKDVQFWVRPVADGAPILAAQTINSEKFVFDRPALDQLLETHKKEGAESHQLLRNYFNV